MNISGSGCGAVGRAIAFDTGDPQFKSNHRQLYLLSTVSMYRKDDKIKRPGMAHILKQKKRIIHLEEELKEKWNVSRCGLKSKKRRTQIALPIVQTEYTFLGFREVCLLHKIYFKRGPLFLLFSSFQYNTVDSIY